jgi:hypothetical protein
MLNLLLNDTLNIYAGLTICFTEEFNVAEMEHREHRLYVGKVGELKPLIDQDAKEALDLKDSDDVEIVVRRLNKKEPMTPEELSHGERLAKTKVFIQIRMIS